MFTYEPFALVAAITLGLMATYQLAFIVAERRAA